MHTASFYSQGIIYLISWRAVQAISIARRISTNTADTHNSRLWQYVTSLKEQNIHYGTGDGGGEEKFLSIISEMDASLTLGIIENAALNNVSLPL